MPGSDADTGLDGARRSQNAQKSRQEKTAA